MTGARLEAVLAPGVVLVDASAMMTRAVGKTGKPLRRRRPKTAIERVYVHHSGAEGRPGLWGAEHSASYVVEKRGFHCAAYHYWIPRAPLYWQGRLKSTHELTRGASIAGLAVLRLNLDSERCWHTGGKANTHGVGVCLQGNLNRLALSHQHKECLEALLPWLKERHNLNGDWLSWHSQAGQYGGKPKKACPGKFTEDWLRYCDYAGGRAGRTVVVACTG